jgi:hypothetical protein
MDGPEIPTPLTSPTSQFPTPSCEDIRKAASSNNTTNHFVIYFISTDDIPTEAGNNLYLNAYLSNGVLSENSGPAQSDLYGKPVHTLRRSYNKSIIWNSFRNFGVKPPPSSYLTVEMLDSETEKDPIGFVHIDIDKYLNDGAPKLVYFEHRKVSCGNFGNIFCLDPGLY